MWDLAKAIICSRYIATFAEKRGWGIAIGGSVLQQGWSPKDMDLVCFPLRADIQADPHQLYLALNEAGLKRLMSAPSVRETWKKQGSNDTKHVEIWETNDVERKRIDIFVMGTTEAPVLEPENFGDMDAYQEETNRTEMKLPHRELLTKNALGLAGEAGETADIIKKHVFHAKSLDPAKIEEELGDTFWYLSQLSRACGTTLKRVARANVLKLRKRYADGYSHEASAARVDLSNAVSIRDSEPDGSPVIRRNAVPVCEHGTKSCNGRGEKHACNGE
jgi:NTP pyrophosphatase (non-canonical NTP hydrolase)